MHTFTRICIQFSNSNNDCLFVCETNKFRRLAKVTDDHLGVGGTQIVTMHNVDIKLQCNICHCVEELQC